MSNRISMNARYLLWRKGIPREQWDKWLVTLTSLDAQTVRSLISGALADERTSAEQVRQLGQAFELEDEGGNLRFANFAGDSCNVLVENLKFLFDSLRRGGKKSLSNELGVDPTTISRWLNGSSEPPVSKLDRIVAHFGLQPTTNLREDAVFLSAEPVALTERRNWLHSRLEALPLDDLRDLYPALRRLLEER
jgi:transcriptional regulator with XRE-family HTH domain